jgi:DNA-binding MarR family transcriptional regulator
LLVFNIGDNEVMVGELKTRAHYQGSNVSYNLKKLVDRGYMHHELCRVDRRLVWVKLTGKGQPVLAVVSELLNAMPRRCNPRGCWVILAWRRSGADRALLSATGAIKSDLLTDPTGSC